MHALRRVAVAGLAGILLGSCSSGVDWENYSPEVKTRIDRMAVEGDCGGLQPEFDVADTNDNAQRNRVGSGNADLMGYIDAKLSEAGCYG